MLLDDAAPAFHELELTGQWSLTPRHELSFTVQDSQRVIGGNTLRLRGELLAAEPEALLVAVTTSERDGERTTRLLRLRGRWQMNEAQRLVFHIARGAGPPDTLTLSAAWTLGPRHELRYEYTRWDGARRRRITQSLSLRGTWAVTTHETLTYTLEGGERTPLSIAATLDTDRLIGEARHLRFRLGATKRVPLRGPRRLVFHGTWRVHERLGLRFEVKYAGGRRAALLGGIAYAWRGRQLTVALGTAAGDRLAAEVIFTQQVPRGLELFLRGRADQEEQAVEGGASLRW